MGRLSRADLEAVLSLAGELGAAAPESQRADQWLLERVCVLLSAEAGGYSQFDASGTLHQDAEYPGPAFIPTEAEWEVFRTQNPFCQEAIRTRNPYIPARRLTDVVDVREFRRTELWELTGGNNLPHTIQMRMPGEPGDKWVFEVDRSGRNFSVRDVMVLNAVRSSLLAYEAHRAVADKVSRLQTTSADAIADAGLSTRENQVLDMVAEGASNSRIAERLWISPGTVRKHLEHVYLKLAVNNRTAALARTGRTTPAPHH